jgi:putative SOS response-associated peptidase YedK
VINAKSETLTFVQMFKDAFRNGRVLIPATGFYEWKDLPIRAKKNMSSSLTSRYLHLRASHANARSRREA